MISYIGTFFDVKMGDLDMFNFVCLFGYLRGVFTSEGLSVRLSVNRPTTPTFVVHYFTQTTSHKLKSKLHKEKGQREGD